MVVSARRIQEVAEMKSRIPWNNHCMRKFGGNIRKEIERIGVAVVLAEMLNKQVWYSHKVISDQKEEK